MYVFPTAHGWMSRWMSLDFISFSVVLQSYQDDGKVLMKDCVQWKKTTALYGVLYIFAKSMIVS